MMRGVLRSLFVVSLLGGMAFAGDPMPTEQAADPKPADSKFETVKRDAPTEGPVASDQHAKKAKHHKSHKARKAPKHHKHHKAKAK
jgi:hypothetical protein